MPTDHYYSRPAPVLPPVNSLPYPANLVVGCSECGLRNGCTRPVPCEDCNPCEVMFVGEAPGVQEDLFGVPFYGPSGQYLNSLLFQCGLPRESVAVSNTVHCRPPNNRTPKMDETKSCSKWLRLELDIVQPRIIVALGKPATDWFLPGNNSTMEHMHGKPVEVAGRVILPCYHPAAALRDTSRMRQVSEDFQVLRGLVKGRDWREYHVVDEYPKPKYVVVDTPDKVKMMEYLIEQAGEFAVDTEQCRGKLWSVQISCKEGEAYFIPIPDDFQGRYDLTGLPGTAVVHNYLFDVNYLNIREDDFRDSMVMAYLVGQSQGLKELASRLCGVKMQEYREIVRPGQTKLSLAYLTDAVKREWPDPPVAAETKWDNKKGCLVDKVRKPWHITRKMTGILSDFEKNPETDLWDRWRKIPDNERSVVDSVIGVMPESSLIDISREQAVLYSARDADVTLRVYHKLKNLIEKLDLDFVLQIDTDILPMVYSMMRNGMPVNLDHFRKLSEDYDVRLRVKAAELSDMVGHPFNPNSSPQVATVVYEELGFPVTKKTPSGEVSTDDAELKRTGHPVAKGVIQYRGLLKLKSTYADNMIRSAYPDDNGVSRIHTVLTTTRVETGRLASKKDDDGTGANLQNIPTRNKESKQIKNGFESPNGKLTLEGDLGQIEMRTQADLAQCKGLIELFLAGRDPHTTTASRIFGVSYEEAGQNKYRYPTKRAGFGIIYMIGAHGLSTQINEYIADLEMEGEPVDIEAWDETQCQKFIDDYYKLYPEIRDYQQEQVAHARRYGYVRDHISGRIRYIPEVTCPIQAIQEAGARMAANFPVTSSAQTVIKMAMGELWQELPRTKWSDALWEMQIHDSIITEVRDDESYYKPFIRWMRDIMCGVVKLSVPITVDFKIGKKWGELEKVKI